MRVMVRNLIIASMALTFFAMFGGILLGSWFAIHIVEYSTDVGTTSDTVIYFKLNGEKIVEETIVDDKVEENEEDFQYDDKDCLGTGLGNCDELDELMIGKIRILLYIVLLAGIAAFRFLNTDGVVSDEAYANGETACLVMGGGSLLALILFITSFPEALDDDIRFFEVIDSDPSFLGSEDVYSDRLNGDMTLFSWSPGIAPLLVLFSGSTAIGAYFDTKNERMGVPKKRVKPKSEKKVDDSDIDFGKVIPLVIPEEWKLEKEEYLVFDDSSVDTFKPKDIQTVDSFKPKEMVSIKCPGCGSQMEIAKLNKMQDVKCDSCGLAGEIKK